MTPAPFLKNPSVSIAEATLQEFVQEAAITRRVLERVPAEHLQWQPHPRAMTLGVLALHVASGPGVFAAWLRAEVADLPDNAHRPEPGSMEEILRAHEHSVHGVRSALTALPEGELQRTCALRKNGATFMTMPKGALLRTLVMNHWIHHRGQLCVYLRLLNVPVPALYGPSADEAPFARI